MPRAGFKPGSPALYAGALSAEQPWLGEGVCTVGSVGRAPACRAGDLFSNTGPVDNYLKNIITN